MYPAKHFIDNENTQAIISVITENPLATLLCLDNLDCLDSLENISISHIPFHFASDSLKNDTENEKLTEHDLTAHNLAAHNLTTRELVAHVSNQHPLAKKLKTDGSANITLIFHGEDAYISPHDVADENRSAQKVPTWNYAKVHVTGTAIEITNLDAKYQQMAATSDHFEQKLVEQPLVASAEHKPWSLTSAPNKAIEQMLNAITIFKVCITDIEGRFKLSQNKAQSVKQEIAEKLIARNTPQIAKQILNHSQSCR